MKGLIVSFLFVTLSCPVWAQDLNVLPPLWAQDYLDALPEHQYSNAPETSRYQIVQSKLGVRLTFKIDKYLGDVYLLVIDADNVLKWEEMIKLDHPFDEAVKNKEKVNYQIFTSGLGIKFTFLLNVNTGATWQLVEDTEDKSLFWSPR